MFSPKIIITLIAGTIFTGASFSQTYVEVLYVQNVSAVTDKDDKSYFIQSPRGIQVSGLVDSDNDGQGFRYDIKSLSGPYETAAVKTDIAKDASIKMGYRWAW